MFLKGCKRLLFYVVTVIRDCWEHQKHCFISDSLVLQHLCWRSIQKHINHLYAPLNINRIIVASKPTMFLKAAYTFYTWNLELLEIIESEIPLFEEWCWASLKHKITVEEALVSSPDNNELEPRLLCRDFVFVLHIYTFAPLAPEIWVQKHLLSLHALKWNLSSASLGFFTSCSRPWAFGGKREVEHVAPAS